MRKELKQTDFETFCKENGAEYVCDHEDVEFEFGEFAGVYKVTGGSSSWDDDFELAVMHFEESPELFLVGVLRKSCNNFEDKALTLKDYEKCIKTIKKLDKAWRERK